MTLHSRKRHRSECVAVSGKFCFIYNPLHSCARRTDCFNAVGSRASLQSPFFLSSALCDNGTAMLGVVVELVLAMMAPGPPSPEPENLRGSLSSLASGSISSRIGRVVEDTLGEIKSRVIEGSERERKGKPSDLRLEW